ncbi:hypothetical protein BDZ45DRAFT_800180 [Acephala macrosclerotiorum]|nr:hypothetical protein BDZ45DRAFT_800180 [Acephala macrosclerotiorum]
MYSNEILMFMSKASSQQPYSKAMILDDISFAEAATIPFAFATAACAIHPELGFPYSPANKATSLPVLIWGASGSASNFAVQPARPQGGQVIAVSTTRSLASAKILGISLPISTPRRQILNVAALETSVANCIAAFDGRSGTLTTAIKNTHESNSKNVQIRPIYFGNIQGKKMGPEIHEKGALLGEFIWDNLTRLLQDGDISPLKHDTTGGMQNANKGWNRVKNGQYNIKLVIQA